MAQLLAQPRGRSSPSPPSPSSPFRGTLGPARPPHPLARPARRGPGARDRHRHRDDLRPDAQRPPLALTVDPVPLLLFALAGGALLAGAARPASWLLAALGAAQLAAWLLGAAASPPPARRSPPPPASARSAGCACSSRRTPAGTTSCARWSSSSADATPCTLAPRRTGPRRAAAASASSPCAARLPVPRRGGGLSCRGRAGAALAVLRGGRARSWTLLRKALRHPVSPGPERAPPRWPNPTPSAAIAAGAKPGEPPHLQVAALCWRHSAEGAAHPPDHQPRHRPLGDPQGLADAPPHRGRGRRPRGLRGGRAARRSSPRSIGLYTYARRSAPDRRVTCAVRVFPLEVHEILRKYPETGQRRSKWFSPRQGRPPRRRARSRRDHPRLRPRGRRRDPRRGGGACRSR